MLQIIATMLSNILTLPMLIVAFLLIEAIILSIAIILNNFLLGSYNDTLITFLSVVLNIILLAYIIYKVRKSTD